MRRRLPRRRRCSRVRRGDRARRPRRRSADDLRGEPPGRHVRARLSGRAAVRGRLRARSTRGARRSRSGGCSALPPSARSRRTSASVRARAVQLAPRRGHRRRPCGPRRAQASSPRAATPSRSTTSGSSPAGSSATRSRRIASCAEPLPQEARVARRARRLVRARRRDRHAARRSLSSRRTPTPSSSPSAWAPTPTSLSGRRPSRRLGVAAVHRGDQDGLRARTSATTSSSSAAATPRSTSRARRAGSAPMRVTLSTAGREDEMPAYPHEVEEARGGGRPVRVADRSGSLRRRTSGSRRVECRRARLGEPDDERPAPPGASRREPSSSYRADTVVKAIGQRPRAEFLAWIDGLELEHGADRRRSDDGQTDEPASTSPPATPSTAARPSSRPSARRSSPRAASTSGCDGDGHERDPLARARRAGREDRVPALRHGAAARRQERPGVPGVRAGAARRAAARVHAVRRRADPPPRLGHAARTSSSCSSRRSLRRGRTSPTGSRRTGWSC